MMNGEIGDPLEASNAGSDGAAHSYRNSRPLSVFALALAAAAGVLGLTWGAHAALASAAADERIVQPPDLKKVIDRVEREVHALTAPRSTPGVIRGQEAPRLTAH